MRAVSENLQRLVVTHDSSRPAKILGGLACLLLLLAAWRFYSQGGPSEAFWGSLGGAITFLLMAAAVFERSRFVIDVTTRLVEWHRWRGFGKRGGRFPFADVNGVYAERPLGDGTDGMSRRVVFRTRQGDVPITVSYLADRLDVAMGLALKLRLMLGLSIDEEFVPAEVQTLACDGRHVEAMSTLRKRHGGSLAEARMTVKALARRRR